MHDEYEDLLLYKIGRGGQFLGVSSCYFPIVDSTLETFDVFPGICLRPELLYKWMNSLPVTRSRPQ